MIIPFMGLVFLLVRLIRKHVVAPRIGAAKFGRTRKVKLKKFSFVMLGVNILAFILGLVAAINFGKVPGQTFSISFGMMLLIAFSIAAYYLDFGRLYIYGLLVGLSPLVGEWLWTNGYATHHGFPITFGASGGLMILIGLAVFVRLLRDNPVPIEGVPSGEA